MEERSEHAYSITCRAGKSARKVRPAPALRRSMMNSLRYPSSGYGYLGNIAGAARKLPHAASKGHEKGLQRNSAKLGTPVAGERLRGVLTHMRSLKSDHVVLEQILNQLMIQLGKPDLAWAFETLDLLWASLAVHIRAENICLFPAILHAPREKFGAPNNFPEYEETKATIEQLRTDHNIFMTELAQAMKEMRGLMIHPESYSMPDTITGLKRRIASVADLLRQHNETEEDVVYRWPAQLLDEESFAQLEIGVKTEIENMPSRFARAS